MNTSGHRHRFGLPVRLLFTCTCFLFRGYGATIDDDPAAWEFTDGTITVTCVDRNGRPIAGAELEMAPWDYDWPPEQQREHARVRADAKGQHTFDHLPGLQYAIHAQAGELGCWEAALHPKPSQKNLNVTMKLDVYHSVSGRVINALGEPVPGVQISTRGAVVGAITDNDGLFRVRHITDQQEFRFYKPGYGWINLGLIPTIRVFELVLPDGGLCEFTVVDANQKPVFGAKVSYDCGNVSYGGGAIAAAYTDEQGKAVSTWISADRPTDVFASYERDGYWWSCKSTVTVGSSETAKLVLEPKATAKIEMTTRAGSTIPAKQYERLDAPKGTVSGKVVMADTGEPIVASIAFDASHAWVREAKAMSNDQGEFRIDGITPGTYYFTVFPSDPTLFTIGGLTRVTVPEDKPVTDLVFKIGKGCVIRGEVRSVDGLPVPNAQVSIRPDNDNHYMAYWTDANGHFFVPHQIHPDKRLTVEVHGPRELRARQEVGPLGEGTISDPIAITIPDLYLKPSDGQIVRGIVVDEENKPMTAVKVSLPPSIAPDAVLTDDDGAFVLAVRANGKAPFTVRSERSVLVNGVQDSDRYDFDILEGGEITIGNEAPVEHVIRVRDPHVKYVAGRVFDEDGKPLVPNIGIYVGECWGGGQVFNGNFIKLGCAKPLTEGPVLLEFTLQGYQARVLESGRDFELGDANIRVVMKKGPFEPFTSVFASVTGRPIEEADAMFNGKRILDHCGMYWELADGPGGKKAQRMYIVKDEHGAPATTIYTRPLTGPVLHSKPDEVTYANMVKKFTNEQGHYVLEDRVTFLWADGKALALSYVPAKRVGEPMVIQLQPEATLTLKVVDASGTPVGGAYVSLVRREENWPNYIDTAPPHPKTDNTGTLIFSKLPPGTYEATAWKTGWFSSLQTDRKTIEIKTGENQTVTLTATSGQ